MPYCSVIVVTTGRFSKHAHWSDSTLVGLTLLLITSVGKDLDQNCEFSEGQHMVHFGK